MWEVLLARSFRFFLAPIGLVPDGPHSGPTHPEGPGCGAVHAVLDPLTGVCKNEIIATNRPATPGFPPTSE